MKAPLTWLKDYVDIDITPEELSEKLLNVGFEVEEIDYLGKNVENVVVGKILTLAPHPDAERLQVCSVDVGTAQGGIIQIVTAGTNVRQGDLVPVALVGARLHDGTIIKKGKLRGIESLGMFCSGKEFNIDNSVYDGAGEDAILIVKEDVALGTDIRKVVGLDEYVLDIGILANRPDCQSIVGIAREIACVLNKPFRHPEITYLQTSNKTINDYVKAEVKSPDLCPRYILTAVDNIKLQQSPKFIRDRLRWAGLNSINNVVDITNFILLEMGQPMHAFDAGKIKDRKINVRLSKNEKIKLLDGNEYNLENDALVIADGVAPMGLAGIMGGKSESVSEDTKTVVFESAKFIREGIRKTSRKYNVRSDSSQMFERGVDAYTTLVAMNRALHLVEELKIGDIAGGKFDFFAESIEKKVLRCNIDKIYDILGIEIEVGIMMDILRRLQFITTFENNELVCQVPLFRQDIEDYPDIAEEIIRVYGYEHIIPTLLEEATTIRGGYTKQQQDVETTKDTLCALGYNEIITYSFVGNSAFENIGKKADKVIRLINPLGEDMSIMRVDLVHNMLNVASTNINRNVSDGRLYEFAKVYEVVEGEQLPMENDRLALCAFGEKEDFFTLKTAISTLFNVLGLDFNVRTADIQYMHPYRTAEILCGGKVVGYLGEVLPDVAEKYGIEKHIYFSEILYNEIDRKIDIMKKFKAIPKYPSIVRDIAITVTVDKPCGDIINCIRQNASKLCENVELFDIYSGKQIEQGYKSIAFKLTFRADDRTLQDKDVEKCVNRVLKMLEQEFGALLRS